MEKLPNVTVLDHPIIQHKVSLLRDKDLPCGAFRELVHEISMLEGYEALRDLKTESRLVTSPIAPSMQPHVVARNLCFVPILRAGLGMADGIAKLLPEARFGHIGLYRDEVTHEPHEYYCKLPDNLSELKVYLVDPMLATGGSAIDAVKMLRAHGAKDISFLCIIAAPEGVKAFSEKCPDIPLYICALDEKLNENAYIVPGLGDAGDRIFGTQKK
ncbi:MAG: uracil phosphoribosyltransferase [Bacilli bacterium]|nr:uracil phosphoribosyltransferase [Bacilli bacterium]